MTVRLIDSVTGDIETSGRQFTSGAEEVAQTIKTRLRLYLGEYFRNINDGTPWWESILGKKGSLASKETIIKNRIIRTNGVKQLVAFSTDFNIDTRVYSISAVVLTDFGETTINLGV